MIKKVFALASVTALTGLVAAATSTGCSDDTPAPGIEAPDAEPDVKPRAPDKVEDDEGDGGRVECYEDRAIDATSVKFQPPRVQPGACTTNVIKVMDDLVDAKKDATFADLKTEIAAKESQACADCVFGPDGDTWAPVVEEEGKVVALNRGGCVAVVSGKEECGKAYHQWAACLDEACKGCNDPSEAQGCVKEVQSTACSAASDALVQACGDDVNAFLGRCFKSGELTITGPIRQLCIGPDDVKDAATD